MCTVLTNDVQHVQHGLYSVWKTKKPWAIPRTDLVIKQTVMRLVKNIDRLARRCMATESQRNL